MLKPEAILGNLCIQKLDHAADCPFSIDTYNHDYSGNIYYTIF